MRAIAKYVIAGSLAVATAMWGATGAWAGEPSPGETEPGLLESGEIATGTVKEEGVSVTWDVVAQKVDVGTEAEARELLENPEEAEGKVLVTAFVKFTLKAGKPDTLGPETGHIAVWADEQPGDWLLGLFFPEWAKGCDNDNDNQWKRGESRTICEMNLIPKGADELSVHWSTESFSGEDFVWEMPQ